MTNLKLVAQFLLLSWKTTIGDLHEKPFFFIHTTVRKMGNHLKNTVQQKKRRQLYDCISLSSFLNSSQQNIFRELIDVRMSLQLTHYQPFNCHCGVVLSLNILLG